MDFLAENFNPELVLQLEAGKEVELPCPDAQPLSNLAEYVVRSTSNKSSNSRRDCNVNRKSGGPGKPSSTDDFDCGDRPEKAGPSRSTVVVPVFRARRRVKNVLTMMERMSGPLGRLRQCMAEKTRIKVWTRSSRRMRGVCSGFVLAFDRHWNIVLGDADDTYLLAVTPPKKSGTGGETGVNSSTQLRERHIGQLFVRGEHVAFVSICP